jgi:hypothetical protein
MPDGWDAPKTFGDEREALETLVNLSGKRWLCRGQAQAAWASLEPSIDRDALKKLGRPEKLERERQSINLFRRTARDFASAGEQGALTDDITALMVLQHYGVPTRLLDWSLSPHVAAYFAVRSDHACDGDLWAFDYDLYATMGKLQWKKWPETTTDRSGSDQKFDAKLTSFSEAPPDWFCCAFYPAGFPRQVAQAGAYSLTARFGVDHKEKISELLVAEPRSYGRYIIKAAHKEKLRTALREEHGIWEGSLFPDSAGAANTVSRVVFPERHLCR